MRAALRCTGYVLFGIAVVMMAAVVLFAGTAALFWLSFASANWLDLPSKYGIVFVVGYAVLGFGGFIGGVLCRENRA